MTRSRRAGSAGCARSAASKVRRVSRDARRPFHRVWRGPRDRGGASLLLARRSDLARAMRPCRRRCGKSDVSAGEICEGAIRGRNVCAKWRDLRWDRPRARECYATCQHGNASRHCARSSGRACDVNGAGWGRPGPRARGGVTGVCASVLDGALPLLVRCEAGAGVCNGRAGWLVRRSCCDGDAL